MHPILKTLSELDADYFQHLTLRIQEMSRDTFLLTEARLRSFVTLATLE